jgi:hypothetical protein
VTNVSNIVGPSSTWEPTNKTVNIRKSTWERLQKHFTYYGCTYDSVINTILDENEKIIDSDASTGIQEGVNN